MPVLKYKVNGIWEDIGGSQSGNGGFNGGNADTLDGKHASDFVLQKDLESKVQEEVNDAISLIDYPVTSVNGKYGAIDLTAEDIGALPKDTVIPSIAGLATEIYVDNKIGDLIESAPDALNTLNELAAALGDDPNFAATVTNEISNKEQKIYKQTEEPTGVSEGTLWIDLDAESGGSGSNYAPAYTFGTEELEPGVSTLATGVLYFCYE